MKLNGLFLGFALVVAVALISRPASAAQASDSGNGSTLTAGKFVELAAAPPSNGNGNSANAPKDKPKKSKKNDGKDGDPDDGNNGGGNDGQTLPGDGPTND